MTALSLITRALRLIGALAQGESPTAAEAQDALATLQDMIDGWGLSKRTHPSVERATFDLVSGEASYTLGEWSASATSPQPTIAPQGTPGTTSYSYRVVATMTSGEVLPAGAVGSTTTGAAALDGTDYNQLTWTALANAATYAVYRTVGGATTGLIASDLTSPTLDDTGLAGDSTSAPTSVTAPPTHFEHAPITGLPDGISTLDTLGLESPCTYYDTVERWQQTPLKDTSGTPTEVYVEAGWPYTTLRCWPVPDDSTVDLVLYLSLAEESWFATLTADADLPRGYADAIRYNLAVRLAPEFGRPLDPTVLLLAEQSLADVKRGNARTIEMHLPAELLAAGGFDIEVG